MVYHTQNYWDFGFCPSSGILGTRKHDVSETGSVCVLRCLPPTSEDENIVSETSCFLLPRTPDDGKGPKTQ
jgi:hypothetical protein